MEMSGMENTLKDCYVRYGGKKLRMGYTTGSCAAAAVRGACEMLFGRKPVTRVELMTPKGIQLQLPLENAVVEENAARCGVRKDAGDDPDTTDKVLVMAEVRLTKDAGIRIDGGEGVGRVTLPGLSQKVGEAAINPVPRAMILREAENAAAEYDYEGGLSIVISVPGGEEIAKKTFNSRLGIEGGISILGTSGIVEPMSEKALLDSIRLEMKQHASSGEKVLLMTPGNYGETYLRDHMDLPFEKNIKCSNFTGDVLDMAVELELKGILFVAHIGKFVKVASGIMNTHSHNADGRMEAICAAALRSGASRECALRILNARTTEEALAIASEEDLLPGVMKQILDRIGFYLEQRTYGQIRTGAVLFSNVHGYLGQTAGAQELIKALKEE